MYVQSAHSSPFDSADLSEEAAEGSGGLWGSFTHIDKRSLIFSLPSLTHHSFLVLDSLYFTPATDCRLIVDCEIL